MQSSVHRHLYLPLSIFVTHQNGDSSKVFRNHYIQTNLRSYHTISQSTLNIASFVISFFYFSFCLIIIWQSTFNNVKNVQNNMFQIYNIWTLFRIHSMPNFHVKKQNKWTALHVVFFTCQKSHIWTISKQKCIWIEHKCWKCNGSHNLKHCRSI